MPSRTDVIKAARMLTDAPFRHRGRSVYGIDCVGLIIVTARYLGLGLDWPEMPYRKFPPEDYVRLVLDRYLDPMKGDPEPGDIALIRWRRTANHLAIVTDGCSPFGLIHAYYVFGRVVEHRADRRWRDMIVGLYSYKGVE